MAVVKILWIFLVFLHIVIYGENASNPITQIPTKNLSGNIKLSTLELLQNNNELPENRDETTRSPTTLPSHNSSSEIVTSTDASLYTELRDVSTTSGQIFFTNDFESDQNTDNFDTNFSETNEDFNEIFNLEEINGNFSTDLFQDSGETTNFTVKDDNFSTTETVDTMTLLNTETTEQTIQETTKIEQTEENGTILEWFNFFEEESNFNTTTELFLEPTETITKKLPIFETTTVKSELVTISNLEVTTNWQNIVLKDNKIMRDSQLFPERINNENHLDMLDKHFPPKIFGLHQNKIIFLTIQVTTNVSKYFIPSNAYFSSKDNLINITWNLDEGMLNNSLSFTTDLDFVQLNLIKSNRIVVYKNVNTKSPMNERKTVQLTDDIQIKFSSLPFFETNECYDEETESFRRKVLFAQISSVILIILILFSVSLYYITKHTKGSANLARMKATSSNS